jgi:hypothetical protein
MLSFAHLWQQAELSDVDVLITAPNFADLIDNAPPQKLAEFPGHTVLLSSSPYLKAQVRCGVHRMHKQNMLAFEQPLSLLAEPEEALVLGSMWPGCD